MMLQILYLYNIKIYYMEDKVNKMIGLLDKAKDEGYMVGCEDMVQSLSVHPIGDDGIPTHCIINPIVLDYFRQLPEGGYIKGDTSRMWHYYKYVRPYANKNMADRSNPYLVFVDGDYLVLECDDEEPQTILPENKFFACYFLMPYKVYRWKVYKGGKVIKESSFRTVGDIRLINLPTWPNLRDIGGFGMKHGLVYSAANPDEVVVGSDDYKVIKYLGIDTQINLRKPKEGSASEKPWRKDIFTYGYKIDIAAYASVFYLPNGFKQAFETLVSELEKGRKVVFNCFAGADRTGTFRYILQGLCGVPKRIAQGHYELTTLLWWQNSKMWGRYDDDGYDFNELDEALEARYGKDFYKQCYRLMTEVVKVSPEKIKKFQDIMKA